MFSTLFENFQPFLWNLKLSSADSFGLEESKICRLEKGKDKEPKKKKKIDAFSSVMKFYSSWQEKHLEKCKIVQPLIDYQTTNLRLFSNWKSLQMSISNLTKNGRKLSKQVEKTGEKGEIARYEQFLLFPQCFQKACFPGASKGVIVWEWVKLKFGSNKQVC